MPPPPPPPPPLNKKATTATPLGGGGSEAGRGLLLESIRQGKALKKTPVVNDRSAALPSASKPKPSGMGNPPESKSTRPNQVVVPAGLGDLFAGGMPKLKSINSRTVPSSAGPPQPPPPSQKPNVSRIPDEPAPVERKLSFGKPSVAPKPPALNNKQPRPNPPPKLPNLYIPPQPAEDDQSQTPSPPFGVNRTQSMRLTPSSAEIPPPDYRTIGRKHTNVQPPPPPRSMNGGNRQRPTPLRPPSAKPPPPPNKVPPHHRPPSPPHTQAPPPPPVSYAPPPPPLSHAPPPPPHRAQAPMVNRNNNLGPDTSFGAPQSHNGPPPPPTRNSSMRNTNTVQSRGGVDLEERFRHLFLPIENLPQPEHFAGITKTYPSKIAQSVKRQPAPQPPSHNQIQLGDKWLNNTSTC